MDNSTIILDFKLGSHNLQKETAQNPRMVRVSKMVRHRTLFFSCFVLFVLFSFPLISSVGASSEMWSQTFGGADMDASSALIQTADGGFALVGFTHSFGNGDSDAWLIKTDAHGNMEWNKTIGGPDNQGATSLIQTLDGGFAFVGSTVSSVDGYIPVGSMPDGYWSFVWLVKTDEYGIPEFPSWTPLLIMLLAVAAVALIYRRSLHKHDRGRRNQ